MEDIVEYYKEQTIILSESINKKTKIYLDTNYWIDICDVTLGKKENKDIEEIYKLLKKGVENNQLICPISYKIFIEILKQNDIQTLQQSAKIIDELSGGIILRERERIDLELFNFFYNSLNIEVDTKASQNYWDYLYNIYGFAVPNNQVLSLSNNFIIQKKYFNDIIKKYKLSDMVKDKNFKQILPHYHNYNIDVGWLNSKKQQYAYENNTLHKMYMSELAGVLDVYTQSIKIIYQTVLQNKAKLENISIPDNNKIDIQPILNLISHSFNKRTMELYLPFIDISTMLYAQLRNNKTRKYDKGDINDIGHATSALPYYDYFFTERGLCNNIKESKHDKKYNCQVASQKSEVLSILKKLTILNKENIK